MFQCDNGSDYVSEGMYRIVDQRGRIGYADESGKTVMKVEKQLLSPVSLSACLSKMARQK